MLPGHLENWFSRFFASSANVFVSHTSLLGICNCLKSVAVLYSLASFHTGSTLHTNVPRCVLIVQ